MAVRSVKRRAGDVFEFTAPDGRFGYGVIIEGSDCPYVIFLRGLYSERPAIEELAAPEIVLVGWTMDALLHHGRWRIIASGYPARSDIPRPNYKVGVEGVPHATDFRGKIIGPVRGRELQLLDYQTSRAPVGFENAFLALHGLRAWDPRDEKLTPEYQSKRVTRS